MAGYAEEFDLMHQLNNLNVFAIFDALMIVLTSNVWSEVQNLQRNPSPSREATF